MPLDAVILGVDPGRENGAGLLYKDHFLDAWPTVTARASRDRIVRTAIDHADERGVPVVAVVETWTPFGDWSFKAALSCGEQAGRWLDSLETGLVPYVRAEPNLWRRGLWRVGRNLKTAEWKKKAHDHVQAQFKMMMTEHAEEATCMAHWGTRADLVAKRLGI